METQRLITMSLGKIAQSRGQRGGINLHKNLLVATVLHKARTAYMMESYNYQQNLQRQKLQQMYHQTSVPSQAMDSSFVGESNKEEVCPSSCDSNLGHPDATPTADEQTMPEVYTSVRYEPIVPELTQSLVIEAEVSHDKENSPPSSEDRLVFPESMSNSVSKSTEQIDHLSAANQLSQDAQLTLSVNTTCKVVKRRKNKRGTTCTDYDRPVSKKARVTCDVSLPPVSCIDYSDFSSDESDVGSDKSDSPQISNLVNIFNSGFSGLCAVNSDSGLNTSDYQSNLDISNSQSQFTPLNKLRSESPTPAFSRMMSEPSLLCSTQISRLESLPSAIILSA